MSLGYIIRRVLAILPMGVMLFSASHVLRAETIGSFDTLTQRQVEQSYYYDWNRNLKFNSAVQRLFVRSKVAQPEWVRRGSGPSAPAQVVRQDSVNWIFLNTCKIHECGNNNLYILFNPPTRETYGVAKLNRKVVWLGKPNATQKALLSKASGYQ